MESFVQFLGRLHPMVLHLPIGLVFGLIGVEVLAVFRPRAVAPEARAALAWFTAVAAAVTAASGLVLSREGGYDSSTVQLHQWLGLSSAAGCLLAVVLLRVGWTGLYQVVLVATVGVLIPAGHYGASMTHGAGYLTAPFRRGHEPAPALESDAGTPRIVASPTSTYATVIAPIFEHNCVSCHNPDKHKGGLALKTPDGILKGGRDGPVIVAGDADASVMMKRLRLPLNDDDHMPPEEKPQPTAAEVKAIADWIAAGASFEAGPASEAAPAAASATAAAHEPAPAPTAAVAALRDRLVHVEPVRQGSALLTVDFAAAAAQLSEEDIVRLLEPLTVQVADLAIARSKAGDAVAALAARMPNLRRLNASASQITDAGVAALAKSKTIEELVLTQTKVTDAAATSLAAMPALKKVFIWKSAITAAAAAPLRDHGVTVEAGESLETTTLETEPEIKLTSDAPVPGQAPTADALKPINTVCPVSGSPVDPKFAIVYKGRVIGFCCPNCPHDFWTDPAKFEGKLKP